MKVRAWFWTEKTWHGKTITCRVRLWKLWCHSINWCQLRICCCWKEASESQAAAGSTCSRGELMTTLGWSPREASPPQHDPWPKGGCGSVFLRRQGFRDRSVRKFRRATPFWLFSIVKHTPLLEGGGWEQRLSGWRPPVLWFPMFSATRPPFSRLLQVQLLPLPSYLPVSSAPFSAVF